MTHVLICAALWLLGAVVAAPLVGRLLRRRRVELERRRH